MPKLNIRYWLCQVLGWGGWFFLNISSAYLFASDFYFSPEEKRNIFFASVLVDFFWCILTTHLLRLVLKKANWMRFSIDKVVLMFIISVAVTGLLQFYGARTTARLTNSSFNHYVNNERFQKAQKMEADAGLANSDYYLMKKLPMGDSSEYNMTQKLKKNTGWYRNQSGQWVFEEPMKGREFWNYIITFILMSMWLLIYLVWHYINKNRNDQLDKLRLETTVKELS